MQCCLIYIQAFAIQYFVLLFRCNKTKVLSVQLGKTLSFVKFGSGVGWRGGGVEEGLNFGF